MEPDEFSDPVNATDADDVAEFIETSSAELPNSAEDTESADPE